VVALAWLTLLPPAGGARAESPIIRPLAFPSPEATEPLPTPRPGCSEVLSEEEFTARSDRPAVKRDMGACEYWFSDEQKQKETQAKLQCLMNGFDNAFNVKVSCTKVKVHTDKGVLYQVHFDSKWRCSRLECPPGR
jgi:hypothetical protein